MQSTASRWGFWGLIGAIVAASIASVAYVVTVVGDIRSSLPLDSLALERDVAVYYHDLARLEFALRLHLLEPTAERAEAVRAATDFVAIRSSDMHSLFERSGVPVFLDIEERVGVLVDSLDRLYADPDLEPTDATLAGILAVTNELVGDVRTAFDRTTQHSIEALTQEGNALGQLTNRILVMLGVLMAASAGLVLLAVILSRAQSKVRRHETALHSRLAEIEQARYEAEEANRTKSRFLASMSHELRTPLNAVLGFAEFLLLDSEGTLTTRQKTTIANILQGGRHLLGLINDILDLARIEADQLNLSFAAVPARQVVADCIDLTVPLGEADGIAVTNQFTVSPSVCAWTDPLRLKQILLNLLSNAVKYNRPGGVVTVEGQVLPDGFLQIAVSDTGIGIAPADHPKVFEMFHRLGADPQVARDGAGIGLSVSKLLVERMGGRIGFHSEPSVGSRFWIDLPMDVSEDAPSAV